MTRQGWARAFLWVAVFGWAIGLGAKIFDLAVLATAWGASPPESLTLMPYGPKYPVDPGTFFQPLSVLMIPPTIGALVAGWKTPWSYRHWLLIPLLSFLAIWILTPTIFWPMIRVLYLSGVGRISHSSAELALVVRRWMLWDSFRIVLIAVGFFGSVGALSQPYPRSVES